MNRYNSGLYTDFYELTMAQGYFLSGMKDKSAVFDLFYRSNPFQGGYAIFAGLEDAVKALFDFSYSSQDIEFLKSYGFDEKFLDYLKNFKFSGDLWSFREGDVVFPNQTLLRVDSNIIEAQLLESILLNIINFQTLIATKTNRIVWAAQGRPVVDFGLRRAQDKASIAGAKAAFIGGVAGTSNTYAAKKFNIPAMGTHAHSWVQCFSNELEAFTKYSDIYPDNSTLLVDTYDTLDSGVPNAIEVAKQMEKNGHKLKAIRLDSGDLAYFSKKARKMLNDAGLDYVKITASNQLDEYLIKSLLEQDSPIDFFGVGTKLICSYDQPALDGVYKMAEFDQQPSLKFSENEEKINNPGKKQVVRYKDEQGYFFMDGIILDEQVEDQIDNLRHPSISHKHTKIDLNKMKPEKLMTKIIDKGKMMYSFPNLEEVRDFSKKRFSLLPDEHKRFVNPHLYRVGLSDELFNLRKRLIERREDNYH
ncbi:MAG: nicotinate phosphoribosyltransferase [bacterium]